MKSSMSYIFMAIALASRANSTFTDEFHVSFCNHLIPHSYCSPCIAQVSWDPALVAQAKSSPRHMPSLGISSNISLSKGVWSFHSLHIQTMHSARVPHYPLRQDHRLPLEAALIGMTSKQSFKRSFTLRGCKCDGTMYADWVTGSIIRC